MILSSFENKAFVVAVMFTALRIYDYEKRFAISFLSSENSLFGSVTSRIEELAESSVMVSN